MKIIDSMRFPYPVLWAQTADYSDGDFTVTLKSIEEVPETGEISAEYEVSLSQLDIRRLVESGGAAAGVFVTCLDTCFNQLVPLNIDGGALSLAPGKLWGQVTFRPVIWVKAAMKAAPAANIHPEFANAEVVLGESSIVALGEKTVISVGSDKLAPIGSVFALMLDEAVPSDQVAVNCDSEQIEIRACQKTIELLQGFRNTSSGRALLLNAVYLPVVMDVLDAARQENGGFEGRRWHTVFRAKLEHIGVDPKTGDLLVMAQEILKKPLSKTQALRDIGD